MWETSMISYLLKVYAEAENEEGERNRSDRTPDKIPSKQCSTISCNSRQAPRRNEKFARIQTKHCSYWQVCCFAQCWTWDWSQHWSCGFVAWQSFQCSHHQLSDLVESIILHEISYNSVGIYLDYSRL